MAFRDTVESPEMQTCIAHCSRCHEVCLKSAAHCLKERGDEWQLVTTLLVCAEVCRLSADTMIRGSELHRTLCGACAEVCKRCAHACSAFERDALLRECGEACRACADSCAAMARG